MTNYEYSGIEAEIKKEIELLKPPKRLPWWKRRLMAWLWQYIERQVIKAKWSWPTTVCGIFAGLALILPEVSKLLDGDEKTVPNETQIAAGFGLMGLGWTAKSATNSGLPPAPKSQQEAAQAPKDNPSQPNL